MSDLSQCLMVPISVSGQYFHLYKCNDVYTSFTIFSYFLKQVCNVSPCFHFYKSEHYFLYTYSKCINVLGDEVHDEVIFVVMAILHSCNSSLF